VFRARVAFRLRIIKAYCVVSGWPALSSFVRLAVGESGNHMNYISSARQNPPPTRERVQYAIFGLLFVALFVWLTHPPAGWVGWYHLEHEGVPAQGTVVYCRHTGHGGKETDFSFTVDEATYKGFEFGCRREIASAIGILYVATNPTIAESQYDQKRAFSFSNFASGFFWSFALVVIMRYSNLYSWLYSKLDAR